MPRAKGPYTPATPYVRPRLSPSPSDDVDGIPVTSHSGIKVCKSWNTSKRKSRTSRGNTQAPTKRRVGEQTGEHDPIVAENVTDDDPILAVAKPSISERAIQRAPKSRKTTWTNDEYVAAFAHVAAHVRLAGRTLFEGVVPGRNQRQTYQMWKTTIEPHIRTMLAWSGKTVETNVIKGHRAARDVRGRRSKRTRTKETKRKVTDKHHRGETDIHNKRKTDNHIVAPGSDRAMYVGDDDTVNEDVDELDSDRDWERERGRPVV